MAIKNITEFNEKYKQMADLMGRPLSSTDKQKANRLLTELEGYAKGYREMKWNDMKMKLLKLKMGGK